MPQDLEAKLYGYYRSTAAYRVRIALGLKGLNVIHEYIHLRNGQQTSADYLAINPAGLVPYWIDAELNLAQSIAIIEYLEETYPDPPLLPKDPASRAVVREVALAVCCDIHPIGNLRVLKRLEGLGVGEADRANWSRHWIDAGFAAIEERLASQLGPFAFGEKPSLADICIVPQVFNARRFGVDLTPYPRIREIDAVASTHEAFAVASPARQPDSE
ncbi:maleylacetoacetate isomerase [uncultured Bradyrhizobium sp.]|uniref:maleylacetoacetate isomerase n=1 Tax=Bradyrhizobium sp. TaxID=376 RepID=UPI00260C9AC4|nr:maleylacetoacetate isomerase [uncultured Bradyrhizobium sp.]